jgi:lysozyme
MDLQKLKEELIEFEGCKYVVYLDSLGLKTAGIGHLLVGSECDMEVGHPITSEQVDKWYAKDIMGAIAIANKSVKNFNQLDDCRQRVLTQLAFNMGNKLLQFKKTLACIESQDFSGAALELKMSRWYTQVGHRGPLTIKAMLSGSY